jgi:hypothetical protein
MPRTYTEYEYKKLDNRRRIGWAKYYELLNNQVEFARVVVEPLRNEEGQIPAKSSLPKHITQEFYDMAVKLNKTYTCPICLELVDKDTIDITLCGHTFHKECLRQAKEVKNECPTCRRKY